MGAPAIPRSAATPAHACTGRRSRQADAVAEDTATETGIEPERAAELIEAGGEAIDVRRPEEWDAGRIAGARQIEINELAG